MSNLTRYSVFGPGPSKAETKADITDHAARTIVGDEAARREAKTARLKQARLESEARLSAVQPPATTRGSTSAAARRARPSK